MNKQSGRRRLEIQKEVNMTKRFFLVVLALFVVAGAALAQTTGGKPVGITEGILGSILGGSILGIPMIGLIQLLKSGIVKLFKMQDPVKPWVGYLSSLLVVVALTFITLSGLGLLNLQNFLSGALLAWMVANGYYKRQTAAADTAVAKALGTPQP
jgi:hypothetical protein